MVIDMKKDTLVIMDWGGVIESHSEESYLAHNVVKHVLEQFTTEPLPYNFNEVFEQSLMGMLYGAQIQTMMPKLHSTNFEGMELIRPLYLIREADIIHWRDYNNLASLRTLFCSAT